MSTKKTARGYEFNREAKIEETKLPVAPEPEQKKVPRKRKSTNELQRLSLGWDNINWRTKAEKEPGNFICKSCKSTFASAKERRVHRRNCFDKLTKGNGEESSDDEEVGKLKEKSLRSVGRKVYTRRASRDKEDRQKSTRKSTGKRRKRKTKQSSESDASNSEEGEKKSDTPKKRKRDDESDGSRSPKKGKNQESSKEEESAKLAFSKEEIMKDETPLTEPITSDSWSKDTLAEEKISQELAKELKQDDGTLPLPPTHKSDSTLE